MEKQPRRGEVLIAILADLGTDHRCFKIASSLRSLGYDPVILCDRPLHPPGESWRGIRVRVLTPASHYRGFLKAFLVFLRRLTPILLTTRSRIWIAADLPPLFWLAWWGRLRGARVVYDAREIILETPTIRNRLSRRLAWTLWQAAGLALTERMAAVSPLAVEYYRARHPGKRIALLPNVPRLDPDPLPEKPPLADEIRLIFQGAFRPGTGVPETVRALARAPRYRLSLYGFGAGEEEIRRLVEELGLSARVRLMGTVPFEEIPRRVAEAHFGLHLMQPEGLNTQYTLSNKIFDYIHGETPMLLGPTAANREFLGRFRVGVIVPTLSADDILAGLDALAADWEAFRGACRAARQAWNWEACEGELARLVGP